MKNKPHPGHKLPLKKIKTKVKMKKNEKNKKQKQTNFFYKKGFFHSEPKVPL